MSNVNNDVNENAMMRSTKAAVMMEERERLYRSIKCALVMLAFWLLILWLLYEHDNKVVTILLSLFAAVVLYMVASIGFFLVSTWSTDATTASIEEEYELTEQEEQQSTLMADGPIGNTNVDTSAVVAGVFAYPFDQTSRRIRSCQEFASPSHAPQDGTYKIVYAAIVFGKQIRSEGHMHLSFIPLKRDSLHNTGWVIQGWSEFGKRPAKILEGFVNAKGYIYWALPLLSSPSPSPSVSEKETKIKRLTKATIYRGKWDLATQSWEDGEFQSIQESPNTSTESGGVYEGRIVRMELQTIGSGGTRRMEEKLDSAELV
jgi:hypothetical protein